MAQIEPLGDDEPQPSPKVVKPIGKKQERKKQAINHTSESTTPEPVKVANEERLTAEEWEEKLKAEAEAKAEQPKTLTKEEFIAMMKAKETPKPQQAPIKPKPRIGFIDRLQANADEALGVKPKATAATSGAVETQMPVLPVVKAESNNLQEIGPAARGLSSALGNPITAGIVALTGLIVMFIGTLSRVLEATLIIEIMGFVIFVFGLVFILKYLIKSRQGK
ncbi:MAG: hypothetical protein QXL94_03960 [Candidatus Parvarchaeum sp.]